MQTVCLIPGDGVGREVIPAAARVLAALLLDHWGEAALGDHVRRAVRGAVAGGIVTPDLGGSASTAEVAEEICRRVVFERSNV